MAPLDRGRRRAGDRRLVGRRPWSIHLYGQSYGCGSAFMGRYIGGGVDPAATGSYACHLQASNRRLLAYVFGAFGMATFIAALSLTLRRSSRTPPDAGSPVE